jgi:hypothetical protein
LVIFVCPALMGHSMSTSLICSHRSALVERSLMRPYLTCRTT